MPIWIIRLIVIAVLGPPIGYGAWWSYTHLPGRYMDTEEAIEAYYAGEYRGAYNAFTRLAAEGHAKAQLGLAELYWNGKVPERIVGVGPYWYEQAANQGNATAAYIIAMEVGGIGDDDRIRWFQLSAKGSHPIAIAELGLNYLEGKYSLRPDHELGREILTRAGQDGNGYAAHVLANAYMFGPLETDPDQASVWYAAAVQAGNAAALTDLVRMRTAADSPLWNPEESYRWKLVQISWQARSDEGLRPNWMPPIEFLVFDESSAATPDPSGIPAVAFATERHVAALRAIDERMRAFATGRYESMGPLPDLDGLFLDLDASAIIRAEAKARLFLNGHPSPPTEPRLFD